MKKNEIDDEDYIDQSDLVSLDDYVAAECLKREASLLAMSPAKITEPDFDGSADRKLEDDAWMLGTPGREVEKQSTMQRIGSMFSAPHLREQVNEFISPLRRGESNKETEPNDYVSGQRRFDSTRRRAEFGKGQPFKFQFGDKFTKRPLQYGKHLVLLGRLHIHVMDLETLETRVLISVGEDQAEKVGEMLRANDQLLEQALKATEAAERNEPESAAQQKTIYTQLFHSLL